MNQIDFNNIVSNQTEITNHKTVVEYYQKITKRCGFLNQKGYNDSEYNITPIKEHDEIRLIQDNDTYSDYIKIRSNNFHTVKVSYGINDKYLIKNIGDDCHTVYELQK